MNKDTLEKFDNYPIYGANVKGFLNLLASIAVRNYANGNLCANETAEKQCRQKIRECEPPTGKRQNQIAQQNN